jgi:hypothetical protein
MDYEGFFKDRLEALCAEVFADLERRSGRFPRAFDHRNLSIFSTPLRWH